MGYIVFDTQDIVEKAHLGDLDYVKHALTLFTDFVAIFVRMLIIMVSSAYLQNLCLFGTTEVLLACYHYEVFCANQWCTEVSPKVLF